MDNVNKDIVNSEDKILIEYSKKNNKICGVLVAFKSDDKYVIGVSKCHTNDIFNKKLGLDIAIGRAKKSTPVHHVIAISMSEQYLKFKERCDRYFKCQQKNDFGQIVTVEYTLNYN